jgi:hypothetical protein
VSATTGQSVSAKRNAAANDAAERPLPHFVVADPEQLPTPVAPAPVLFADEDDDAG